MARAGAGRAGRRQRVPGGFPVVREVRLTLRDAMVLRALAARTGLSDGAYAAQVVQEHLRGASDGRLPDGARAAWRSLAAQRAEVVALSGQVAAVGRLANAISRHLNRGGPPPPSLGRLVAELESTRVRVQDVVAELDRAAAALTHRLQDGGR